MKNNKISTNLKTTLSTKKFTHDELLQALYFVWDMMDRVPIPFFLMEETAEAVMNHKDLSGDAIHIGVRDTDWNGTGLNILALLMTAVETGKKQVKYIHNGVPIYVHIYKNHPFIESTNTVLYENEAFKVPNPYEGFLQIRHTL